MATFSLGVSTLATDTLELTPAASTGTLTPPTGSATSAAVAAATAAGVAITAATGGQYPNGYEVRVVDMYGVVKGILNPDPTFNFSLVLNGIGDAQITASTFDTSWLTLLRPVSGTADLAMLDREIQIWRYGTLLWQGKPTRVLVNNDKTTLTCSTLEWFLKRSNFGPIQKNYLLNPDFEMGSLANWAAVGCTATVQTATVAKGTYAAQLVAGSSGNDWYLHQTVSVTTQALPVIFTLAAQTYSTSFTNPALNERGLYLGSSTGTPLFNFAKISASTGVGKMTRLVTSIVIPANTTDTLDVRLYAPQGTTIWDDVSLTIPESVSSDLGGTDMGQILQRVAVYFQNQNRGRAPLNMAFQVAFPGNVGTSRVMSYQFSQHGSIFDAFVQAATEDLCDFAVVPNATGTSRTLYVYPGRRGSLQLTAPIIIDNNAIDVRVGYDGDQAASQVRVLGVGGGGSDQEVGVAVDTSLTGGRKVTDGSVTAGSTTLTSASAAFTAADNGSGIYSSVLPLSTTISSVTNGTTVTLSNPALVTATNATVSIGGLILDSVQSVPMETPIGGLAARALTEQKRLRSPVLTVTAKIKDRFDIAGVVFPGDTVPVNFNYGWMNFAANLRVSMIRFYPALEAVELTLMIPAIA